MEEAWASGAVGPAGAPLAAAAATGPVATPAVVAWPTPVDRLLDDRADPDLYLPRRAPALALSELEALLRDGSGAALLAGEPGAGKTMVLRLLARCLGDHFEPVFVPFLRLSPDELDHWLLGWWTPDANPTERLADRLERRGTHAPPVLFLLDEAGSIPAAVAPHLAERVRAHAGRAAWVFAGTPGISLDRLAEALAPELVRVELRSALSEQEIEREIERLRLVAGGCGRDEDAMRLAELDRQALVREAAGVPRRLRGELLRSLRGPARPAASDMPVRMDASQREAVVMDERVAEGPTESSLGSPGPLAALARVPQVDEPAEPERKGDDAIATIPSPGAPPRALGRWSHAWTSGRIDALKTALLFVAFGSGFWVGRVSEELPRIARPSLPALLPSASTAGPPTPSSAPGAASVPADTVSVRVNSVPWATVIVDGEDRGVTPIGDLRLVQGPHEFELHLPDGRVIRRRVHVGPGNDRIVYP